MNDEKYIVFKKEEFIAWREEVRRAVRGTITWPDELGDAVVIRTQDVFAAAGLSAYALNIRTYIGGVFHFLPPEMVDKLLQVADYFASVAQEAEDRLMRGECKVPD